MLPTINVQLLKSTNSELETPVTLDFLSLARQFELSVVDLWHTKCTRCPAVLEKFNTFAETAASTFANVGFYSCSLSQGRSDVETVEELINDWENLNHIFIAESDKDALKAALGYTAVPFYFVFNKEGKVVWSGEPKSVNLEEQIPSWLEQSSAKTPASTHTDENQKTNTTQQPLVFDEDF